MGRRVRNEARIREWANTVIIRKVTERDYSEFRRKRWTE